uniref:Uncharacterized protein n=1 Tax=Magnetococcus massalia (strain MO-1) TaxID=451514 RepID=A0A1S7LET1_MAGMO|nr:Exported protein of unknown function [Candidatus Magnetococcus massalia]
MPIRTVVSGSSMATIQPDVAAMTSSNTLLPRSAKSVSAAKKSAMKTSVVAGGGLLALTGKKLGIVAGTLALGGPVVATGVTLAVGAGLIYASRQRSHCFSPMNQRK